MPPPTADTRFFVTRPFAGIYHVQFPERPGILGLVDIAFHFLRFQEHYESPAFKGRVFSWSQYAVWYRRVRGEFSYHRDWDGYNFPGAILAPFRLGAFDPLTTRERALLKALSAVQATDYVIGTRVGDPDAVVHELAHACWALDAEYHRNVKLILAGGDFRRQMAALAQGEGYDPKMHLDEIQASAVDGCEDYAPDEGRCILIREAFHQSLRRMGPLGEDIPAATLRAYREARYRVGEGGAAFEMRVGRACAPLKDLLAREGRLSAVCISAHNPRSRPSGRDYNEAAHGRLRRRLGGLPDLKLMEGDAVDPSGLWPTERFVLALGLSAQEGLDLAREFDQNAILYALSDGVPQLAFPGPGPLRGL